MYQLFLSFGPISDVVISLDTKGRSRGFCDVQFEEPEDASAAIDNMNGAQVMGRTLRVRQATKEIIGNQDFDRKRASKY